VFESSSLGAQRPPAAVPRERDGSVGRDGSLPDGPALRRRSSSSSMQQHAGDHQLMPLPSAAAVALAAAILSSVAAAPHGAVTLSNTQLPRDQFGKFLVTGEASVVPSPSEPGIYYFYFNNWGECYCGEQYPWLEGCCSSKTCVYGSNHSVVVYRTNLTQWEYKGVALSRGARKSGTEFRPCVVYCARTRKYVMWYEDRHPDQQGYAIASANSPAGPFHTVVNATGQTGGKIGDFDILVDDNGAAYQVRTGNIIQQLTPDYLGVQGNASSFSPPKALKCGCEGPVFFKHQNVYYITLGSGCCACKGGSTIFVFSSSSPMGPYTYQSDIGTVPGSNGNASTCASQRGKPGLPGCVYSWRAQATGSFQIGGTTVLLGNQWQTSGNPPGSGPRNADLLYFAPLKFSGNTIDLLTYAENVTIPVAEM
jgi:hypothetical protein